MNNLIAIATEVCTGSGCETVNVDGSAIAGILAAVGGFIGFFIILGLLGFGFWLWMLIDSLKADDAEYKKVGSGEKTLWVALMIGSVFVGFSFVMALVYYFVIYKKKKVVTPEKK